MKDNYKINHIMNTITMIKNIWNRMMLRRWLTGVALLMTTLIPIGQAMAAEVFEELAGMPQVESTFISGRFAHSKKTWRSANNIRHSLNLEDGFSSLYSYHCYSKESVSKARQILNTYIKTHPEMELVMRSNEGGNNYELYESFINDNTLSKLIIWDSVGDGLCEVVVINWKDGFKRKGKDQASKKSGRGASGSESDSKSSWYFNNGQFIISPDELLSPDELFKLKGGSKASSISISCSSDGSENNTSITINGKTYKIKDLVKKEIDRIKDELRNAESINIDLSDLQNLKKLDNLDLDNLGNIKILKNGKTIVIENK